MRTVKDNIILFIALGAYSGRFPVAPGTAGTAAAVPLYLLLQGLTPPAYGAACLAVTLLGTWAAGRAEALLGKKDASPIVIDEIAGFLVAMFLVPFAWWALVTGFVLFRIFDILKPWPLHGLQKVSGGPGVMLDDLGAGIYTNALLQVASYITGKG